MPGVGDSVQETLRWVSAQASLSIDLGSPVRQGWGLGNAAIG